ncbi:hypothetical protein [Streptomyces acidicola]|uniref:Helix-turn-helix domain-containing protein n=1 Tax=Streptomyces acidicola TaxID=2596892 RepID=A0A5N8WYI1_9ACTN|nr:hypothetical protein [Streptomyces acidicola]MPY52397.1 hypothetical protein [Streptomyces acidicola]
MAEPQSNARLRADAGAPTSGVIHVRTRLTADFTVIANALAQRRGSAVTVGVAAYILSLPDGAIVSIAALCAHFTEGEILISRALRELEAAGYLERRRERGPDGQVRTRTCFYDVPRPERQPTPPPGRPTRSRELSEDRTPARTPQPSRPPSSGEAEHVAAPAPVEPPSHDTESPAEATHSSAAPPPGPDEADPQAVVLLASLRIVDRRLVLSHREVAELAPAVSQWLARGLRPEEITGLLTDGLPDRFRSRPARVLAYRLREVPIATAVPAAAPDTPPAQRAVLPWQTCDGCERAFRASEPSRCRDCRSIDEGYVGATSEANLPAAC